jgi:hypothetical protein
MSAIISAQMAYTGVTLWAIVRDLAGLVANGSGLESFNVSNYSIYIIPMAEQVPTGYFKCAFPSYLPRGKYTFSVHQGSGIAGDLAVDQGSIDWNGSTEDTIDTIIAKLPSGLISGFDPSSQNVNLNANQSGVTIGIVNALGAAASAAVKTQIDQSLGTDIIPELTGVPPATPTLKVAIMFLLMGFRNKRTSTASTIGVYNASGAVITTASQSDNGVVYDKENFS